MNRILYGLLTIAIIGAVFSMFQTKKLHKKLKESQIKETQAASKIAFQNKLLQIDSMLVKGQYKSAIDAYKKQFDTVVDNFSTDVKLRIELAQQLMDFSIGTSINDSISDEQQKLDSINANYAATPFEIRRYDSLNFVLEKTRVQLSRMKKQLQKKSGGQYLTFKNTKKHKLHYVGQVRNNKANGYGIALFDTGSRYEGEWQDNLRHGEGSFYWPDGESYQGEYQNDRRNGMGTYFWPNGEKYTGHWKNDQRDGEGVFYGKDGKIVTQGVWKDDKLIEENKDKK
ncbi:hypothetical protein [Aquimarina gracilis]